MDKIRWAIVGTGYIANEFARGMHEVGDAELAAVVSRSPERGQAFAKSHGGGAVYADLREMLGAEKPDVVYVAIPNDLHFEAIMTALEAGANVLSEKPMVDNAGQLDAVLGKAAEKDLFLMEGMWTRCFPAVVRARQWIREGRIGRPLTVRASFDIKPAIEDWQPWKGGIAHAAGALRDVGIYSLAMADLAFGREPERINAAMRSNGEVDHCFRMLMDYGEGRTALVGGAFDQVGDPEAEIVGELGRIVIGPLFWKPDTAALELNDGSKEIFRQPYPASGFQYEIMAVQECLAGGKKQCPHFTWEETVRIAGIIERTRKEWGIWYEADKEAKQA